MKITEQQQKVIDTMRKYPKEMIMFNGYITGGYGVKFDLRTVDALKRKGIIVGGKLSEQAK